MDVQSQGHLCHFFEATDQKANHYYVGFLFLKMYSNKNRKTALFYAILELSFLLDHQAYYVCPHFNLLQPMDLLIFQLTVLPRNRNISLWTGINRGRGCKLCSEKNLWKLCRIDGLTNDGICYVPSWKVKRKAVDSASKLQEVTRVWNQSDVSERRIPGLFSVQEKCWIPLRRAALLHILPGGK